ncbi:unnamed protein product [Lepidochelys kempii]
MDQDCSLLSAKNKKAVPAPDGLQSKYKTNYNIWIQTDAEYTETIQSSKEIPQPGGKNLTLLPSEGRPVRQTIHDLLSGLGGGLAYPEKTGFYGKIHGYDQNNKCDGYFLGY